MIENYSPTQLRLDMSGGQEKFSLFEKIMHYFTISTKSRVSNSVSAKHRRTSDLSGIKSRGPRMTISSPALVSVKFLAGLKKKKKRKTRKIEEKLQLIEATQCVNTQFQI